MKNPTIKDLKAISLKRFKKIKPLDQLLVHWNDAPPMVLTALLFEDAQTIKCLCTESNKGKGKYYSVIYEQISEVYPK